MLKFNNLLKILFCIHLLISAKCLLSQNYNHIYRIYGIKEHSGGDYYYHYSHDNKSLSKTQTVEIHITNNDDIKVQYKSVCFISMDDDTIFLSTDSNGVINVPRNIIKLYPRIYIAPLVYPGRDFNYRPIKYDAVRIFINNYLDECSLDKIYITLKKQMPDITFYYIESQRILSKNELDCLKSDILTGEHSCSVWGEIRMIPYIEI